MTSAQNGRTGFRGQDSSKQIDWQSLDGANAHIDETEQQYREFIKEALWEKDNSESFHSFVEGVEWYRAQ